MQKNNFICKLKNDKSARAIVITITLMLLVLTAIIIATVIANRPPEDLENPPVDTPTGVEDPDDTPNEPGNDTPNETPNETPTDALPSRFLLPVSGVLQSVHDADLQVFSPTMQDYRVHLGIDIATVEGASVSAMADGTVAQIWDDVRMGRCVAIKHGGDAYTIYKNLAAEHPESVVVGATVKAGDVIGTVGESAMVELASDPHLHLEMTVSGIQVDPTDYFDEDAMATLKEDTNYEDAS